MKKKRAGSSKTMADKWPTPLEASVLHSIIAQGSAYGLELVDLLDLKRGSVYVILQRLEEKSLVFSQVEVNAKSKNRRYYWATPHGEKFTTVLNALDNGPTDDASATISGGLK